jgi:hypothetical protein
MIIQIDDVLVSAEILTESFCCDLSKCKGICCIEGDAGAPITLEEVALLEDNLDVVKKYLSTEAQLIIAAQGVAYTDKEGDLVTSIVNGKDCVFTCYKDISLNNSDIDNSAEASDNIVKNCCLCAYERAYRKGLISWPKPISCALYPIRESHLSNGMTALVYHRWEVCKDAIKKGKELSLPLYRFLKDPLIRRFGPEWYEALCTAAKEITTQ